MSTTRTTFFCRAVLIALLFVCTALATPAQTRRDSLTVAEADLVRDAQQLDLRTKIFIRAIERRLLILQPTAAAFDQKQTGGKTNPAKKPEKDREKWGEPPIGTRSELIADINKILDEAMSNLTEVHRRDAKSPLLAKSLEMLAAANKTFLTEFNRLLAQTTERSESVRLAEAIESSETIIAANEQFKNRK